jgi:hypothetical protein
MALGYSSMDTMQFTYKLGDHLAEGYEVFKPLSSKDLYWETISAQRHFYGDFENIIHLSSQPIRSFYLNANQWQEDIAQLIDRMDYFVVYVSSITKSVLWELEQLQRRRRVEHTTVVFDDEAIDKKDTQTGLRDWAERELPDDVLWAKDREGAPAPSAQELRDQLGQTSSWSRRMSSSRTATCTSAASRRQGASSAPESARRRWLFGSTRRSTRTG